MADTFKIKIGEQELSLEPTDLAEQANGAVLARIGDTVVLVTSVMSRFPSSNQGFFPLSVEYEERFYAAGKILGSRFVRREGRPTDEAILSARLIDRAIRPLFKSTLRKEVQVIATCLSWDTKNDPDIISLMGASASLLISDIPWQGPVAALRIGRVGQEFILNPTYEQRTAGDMDFLVAGIKEGNDVLVNMIEGSSNQLPEEIFEKALAFAKPHLAKLIEFQETIRQAQGKTKQIVAEKVLDQTLEKEIRALTGEKLKQALFGGTKHARMNMVDNLKEEVILVMEEKYPGKGKNAVNDFFETEIDTLVHEAALKEDKRVDDRKLDEIRPLGGKAGLLPRTHGSGLFSRGQTKTLSLLTLGAPGDQKILEGMEFIGKKRFMHHYNFPPYAPGEVKPMRGPGRREIGHGMLAEKALLPVIPSVKDFPYTIRIVTEVVSSNGSTSMASTCSSSLALMDAGVPITSPVAGISVGLMSDQMGNAKLLTDIQGPEDHYGDMDFKVAGTAKGITAIQLDVKIRGLTQDIFKEALSRAKTARLKILSEVIAKILPYPRAQLSPLAPKIFVIQINPSKIGMVIGSGGKTINKLIEEFGVEIDIDDSGEVFVTGENEEQAQKAVQTIKDMVREVQIGEIFEGKVKKILDFGAFVELLPGQEGMVHISQLDNKRVEKVTDVVKVGDIIPVKVIGIDDQGRINLSLKEARNEKHG